MRRATIEDLQAAMAKFVTYVQAGTANSCWPWKASILKSGYGYYTVWIGDEGRDETWRAHRMAWALENGRIPGKSEHVLHSCDNPPCVNPRPPLSWYSRQEHAR